MRALVSSGRSDLVEFLSGDLRVARVGRRRNRLDRYHCHPLASAIECRASHRDDLDRVLRLHGRERIACVDRTHEGVGRNDRRDFRHLRDIEFGGDPRQHVLAESGRGRQHVRIGARKHAQRRARQCSRRWASRGAAHRHAGLSRRQRPWRRPALPRPAFVARDEDVNLGPHRTAQLPRGGDRVQRRGLERRVVVFGYDEDGHDDFQRITLASLRNLATSSCTSATLPPPLRLGGSTTLSVTRRGVTSTPKAAGVGRLHRLLLRLHDVRQRRVARLVQAQVRGHDRRQLHLQRLQAAVDFPLRPWRRRRRCPPSTRTRPAASRADAASIWPVWLASSSMACLPRMTSCGCSFATTAASNLATASGCSSTSVSTRIARSAPKR